MTLRVFIADDHGLVRSGLRRIVAMAGDLEVAGEAANGEELLQRLGAQPADLVLLDITMPGLSGVDLIRRLAETHPSLPVLVLSMHNEGQVVTRALRAGARGYMTKDCEPEQLIVAMRKVAAGGRYIDPSLVDSVVFQGRDGDADAPPHELLSTRELQVLQSVAAGMPLGAIADLLHVSPKTVSTHKMRLMQKLGVSSNAELLKYALRHGLTSE